jgi:hypothetical protein
MSVPGNLYTPTIRKTRGGDYLIEQSLLFDGSTTYLNRTPSTAGNRKTWTYSVWFKKMAASTLNSGLFQATDNTGTSTWSVRTSATNGGRVEVLGYPGSVVYQVATNAILRDPNAWYHVVVAFDTTQSTASDRIKIWINGVLQTSLSVATYPTQNYDGQINNNVRHDIGYIPWATQWHNGPMALPILVDGAALDPTSFGEEDDDGYWNPIEFTGATTTDNVSVGGTASAESTFLTYVPANAFDGNTSTRWVSSATPAWLEYDRGSGNGVISTSYSISCGPSGTASTADMPKNWTIEGYNGSSWDTLATVTGEAAWSLGETRLYTFTNTTSYEKYRIDVTLQQGGGAEIEIGELTFYASGTGFGTNGFQLDYADTAAYGADVKTNTNTMTPTFEAQYYNTSNLTTYTFSTCDLGTADADRSIIVAVGAGRVSAGSRTVSSLTIGGVSATFAGRKQTVNLNANEIWYAKVPTGATGDVVVTFNSGMLGCGIGIWSVLNLGPVQDVQGDNTSGGVASQSVSIGGGESAFAVFNVYDEANPSGLSAVSWSTATERYEDLTVEGQSSLMGADYTFSSAANATTVTATYTGTGGNDGSLLGVTFGKPNDNFYKANNFTAADQLSDTPTDSAADEIGNYAVIDPNGKFESTLSEGNLKVTGTSVTGYTNVGFGTLFAGSGKYYWECEWVSGIAFSYIGAAERGDPSVVSCKSLFLSSAYIGRAIAADSWAFYADTGQKSYQGTGSAYGSAASATDILAVALDMDNGKIWVSVNGVWQNSGDPAAGTGEMFSGLTGEVGPAHGLNEYAVVKYNFGQTAFTYTPPTGFEAFATQNMPAPDVPNPDTEYYQGKFTTESSGSTTVTIPSDLTLTDGFMVRIKRISGATQDWYYCDTVNGAGKHFPMDATSPTQGRITDANLFVSTSGQDIVFGTSLTASTEYLIEVFKIGDYFSVNNVTMTAGPTGTYNPGLGVAPGFIVGLQQSAATNQAYLYHRSLGKNAYLSLNNTTTVTTLSNAWGSTAPSASSVTMNVLFDNATTVTFYNWGQGGPYYFGTHEGNASADGPIATGIGFPQATFIKPIDTAENWTAHFSAIDTYNPRNTELNLRSDAVAGGSGTDDVDFLSNGLKIRGTNTSINPSSTVVYGVFGLRPIQGDDGVTQGRAR